MAGVPGRQSLCVTLGETEAAGLLGDSPRVRRTKSRPVPSLAFHAPSAAIPNLADSLALSFLPPVWAPPAPSLHFHTVGRGLAQPPPSAQPRPLRSCWLRSHQLLLSERVQRCCLGTKHRWLRPLPAPLPRVLLEGEVWWIGHRGWSPPPRSTLPLGGRVLRPRMGGGGH